MDHTITLTFNRFIIKLCKYNRSNMSIQNQWSAENVFIYEALLNPNLTIMNPCHLIRTYHYHYPCNKNYRIMYFTSIVTLADFRPTQNAVWLKYSRPIALVLPPQCRELEFPPKFKYGRPLMSLRFPNISL
jgi:hypothetical protein